MYDTIVHLYTVSIQPFSFCEDTFCETVRSEPKRVAMFSEGTDSEEVFRLLPCNYDGPPVPLQKGPPKSVWCNDFPLIVPYLMSCSRIENL